MAVIVLTSASGSPGVTTTALGMSLRWPRHVLLADLDRDPSQAVEAGYLRGLDLGGRGLNHVARAHRELRGVAEELWQQSVPLDESGPVSRRFLPGFNHPGAAAVFEPVWSEVAAALRALGTTGTDVVVDAGRLGRGLAPQLVAVADVVLVCVRSNLRSLAGLRLHLPSLALEAESSRCQTGLVMVGPGRPYRTSEVAQQFGLPVWGELPWEPKHAEALLDGASARGSQGLLKAMATLAGSVDERLGVRGQVIDGALDSSWFATTGVVR